jgi:hypothetical protein
MKRLLATSASFLLVCATALACSQQSFTKPEPTGPNFTVAVTHRDRPASGIEVTLAPEHRDPMSIGASDDKGRVEIRGLSNGRYFLRAKYREIETETKWIEVTNTPKKRNMRFDLHWADYSIDTREVSGVLTGLVGGNTGNKIMDLIHAKEVAHSGVALSLKSAFAESDYSTISDSSGSFLFGTVPPGNLPVDHRWRSSDHRRPHHRRNRHRSGCFSLVATGVPSSPVKTGLLRRD